MIICTESFTKKLVKQWCQNMCIWCYPGEFPDKVTPDVDFTGEVVQCDVPFVKILLYMVVIYKWSQINFYVNT